MNFFLGIDTSCYTTSVAILDDNANLVAQSRKLLNVAQGKRGLAQSEMVFQHTRNLPAVFADVVKQMDIVSFAAAGVSVCPRPVADSYMPAFLVGKGYASVIALSQGIECYGLSHQENHIYAGLWSAGGLQTNQFLALHVSGGTTELVKVRRTDSAMMITLLAATQDISAGQLIDRTGVKLALPFPAGPHLEQCAALSQKKIIKGELPVAFHEGRVSFSGPETYLNKRIAAGDPVSDIAAAAQYIVAETLGKMMGYAIQETGIMDVLLVGGVMSNQFLRSSLLCYAAQLNSRVKLYFAQQEYSSDHAVGAAYFSLLKHHLALSSIN